MAHARSQRVDCNKKQPGFVRTKGLLPRYHLNSPPLPAMHFTLNHHSGVALTGNPAPFYSPMRDFFGGFTGRPSVRVELGRLSACGAPFLSVTGNLLLPAMRYEVWFIIAGSVLNVKRWLERMALCFTMVCSHPLFQLHWRQTCYRMCAGKHST